MTRLTTCITTKNDGREVVAGGWTADAGRVLAVNPVQGYLAHEKQPHTRTLQ